MGRKTTVYKVERHKWPDEIAAEKRRSKIAALILSVGIVCFLLGSIGAYMIMPRFEGTSTLFSDPTFDKLKTVYSILENNWYFGKDIEDLDTKLIDGAIEGMLMKDVDLHTSYMLPESATDFVSDLTGSISGIGVQYYNISDSFIIERVFQDTPAEIAGLKQGDEFKQVDGKSVEGLTSDELRDLVRGETGSMVEIVVQRGEELVTVNCRRSNVDTTTFLTIVDDVALLEINSFAESTGAMVTKKLGQINQEGIKKIIFDLRNDTGGYLSTLKEVGNLIAPSGTILIQQKARDGSLTVTKSTNVNPYKFDKIVVLVNENTASAAEVFAALLKEGLNATVIGKTTYGKGTVQTPYSFKDGSLIKYTVAEWLTTNGTSINGIGISPDIEVDNINVYNYTIDFKDEDVYEYDQVSSVVVIMQQILDLLGYNPGRDDGYFSNQTKQALESFEKDFDLVVDGILDKETYDALLLENTRYYYMNEDALDIQLQTAYDYMK